jgi:hypothetical protein
VLILEDIIVDEENNIVKDVHIENGKVTFVDPKEKIKNLEEYIDGSPAVIYDPQKNISY